MSHTVRLGNKSGSLILTSLLTTAKHDKIIRYKLLQRMYTTEGGGLTAEMFSSAHCLFLWVAVGFLFGGVWAPNILANNWDTSGSWFWTLILD